MDQPPKDLKDEHFGVVYAGNSQISRKVSRRTPDEIEHDQKNGGMYLLEHTRKHWDTEEIRKSVENVHAHNTKCFIQVELRKLQHSGVLDVIRCSVETDFDSYSEKSYSPKLLEYKKYNPTFNIPLVIWCAEPRASYSVLMVKPWLSDDVKSSILNKSKTVKMFLHQCLSCEKPDPTKKCPCGKARYCNTECQKDNWIEHKKTCQWALEKDKTK